MCAPNTAFSIDVNRLLVLEGEQQHEEDWPLGEPEPRDRTSNIEAGWGGFTERGDDEDDVLIYFRAGGRTGLTAWQFHPYDPDFFPSVPHGHHLQKAKMKLDAYLGWIYQRSNQVGREPRWKIIELWNDQQFRVVAADALNYYLTNHPTYRGWRVVNPRKLPRRRVP